MSFIDILPDEFDYEVVEHSDIDKDDCLSCKYLVRVGIRNESDGNEWMRQVEQRTKTQWNSVYKRSCNSDHAHYVLNRHHICHHTNCRKVYNLTYYLNIRKYKTFVRRQAEQPNIIMLHIPYYVQYRVLELL